MQTLTMHDWSSLRSELLWIYDAPVVDWARHFTPESMGETKAWFFRRGRVTLKTSTRTFRARADEWLVVPQDVVRQDFSADAHILSVSFRCHWPSGESLLGGAGGLIAGADVPELERMGSRLERMARKHFPDAGFALQAKMGSAVSFLECQSLLHKWLARLISAGGFSQTRMKTEDERLWRAMRLLNDAPLDEDLPAGALRAEIGLSQVHLDRLFVREFGLTTRKYWERRRMDFARRWLETTEVPVKEISWRLGFTSDSYFIAWFRRHAGQSPGRHRREG